MSHIYEKTFFGNEPVFKLISLLTVAMAIMLTRNKITLEFLCVVYAILNSLSPQKGILENQGDR